MDFFEGTEFGILGIHTVCLYQYQRSMIQIEFSPAEIEQLRCERYYYPHPQVQKKMDVFYLKSQRLPHKEICRLCSLSKTTLTGNYSGLKK